MNTIDQLKADIAILSNLIANMQKDMEVLIESMRKLDEIRYADEKRLNDYFDSLKKKI